jgi:hypothetical protein
VPLNLTDLNVATNRSITFMLNISHSSARLKVCKLFIGTRFSQDLMFHFGSEFPTAVTLQSKVFWVIKPYISESPRRFRDKEISVNTHYKLN